MDVALFGFALFVFFMFVVVCITDVSHLLGLVFQSALQYDVFCLYGLFLDLSILRFVRVLKLYGVLGFSVLCWCFCVLWGALLVFFFRILIVLCVFSVLMSLARCFVCLLFCIILFYNMFGFCVLSFSRFGRS